MGKGEGRVNNITFSPFDFLYLQIRLFLWVFFTFDLIFFYLKAVHVHAIKIPGILILIFKKNYLFK